VLGCPAVSALCAIVRPENIGVGKAGPLQGEVVNRRLPEVLRSRHSHQLKRITAA